MQSIGRILNCWLWTQLKTFTVSHVRTLNQIKRIDFSTFKRSNCQEKKILGYLNFSEIIVKVFYITSAKPSCSNVTENVIFARNTSLSVSINWPILNGVDAKESTFLFGHFRIYEPDIAWNLEPDIAWKAFSDSGGSIPNFDPFDNLQWICYDIYTTSRSFLLILRLLVFLYIFTFLSSFVKRVLP